MKNILIIQVLTFLWSNLPVLRKIFYGAENHLQEWGSVLRKTLDIMDKKGLKNITPQLFLNAVENYFKGLGVESDLDVSAGEIPAKRTGLNPQQTQTIRQTNDPPLILLDFGHGGLDPYGKYTTAPSKQWEHKGKNLHKEGWFYEGVFNRDVGELLCGMLDKAQINYHVLSHEWKDTDLNERIRKANQLSENENVLCLVSIHSNASDGGNPRAKGMSVFVSQSASGKSKMYASDLTQRLKKHCPHFVMREQAPKQGFWISEKIIGILDRTICPAILSENGFFTNPDDAEKLCEPDTIHRIAVAHFETIAEIVAHHKKSNPS